VRSAPYSQIHTQFNREPLAAALKQDGIGYSFLGKELGGRPADKTCYENGRVQYPKVAATPIFRELSVINRLIVAEEGVPVERRYSFPVGIFTREVKAPRSSSDLGKGQRRERGPHGHDTGYLTFPRPRQPRSRLGRGVRGYHSAPVPDL